MEAVLLCSKIVPRATPLEDNRKFSFRHLNKHLKCQSLRADSKNTPLLRRFEAIRSPTSWVCAPFPVRKGLWVMPRCSISSSAVSDSDNPFLSQVRSFSFGSLVNKVRQLKLKPMDAVKLSIVISILTVAAKKTVNLVFEPFFWMYFSWTWLFWPWFIAVGLAGYGFYCFRKHWLGEANAFEQLGIVTSVFTWLTLVPPAYFNGYLEGWPYVFFLAYHYFFFFNVSVRKRLYGDYYARTHDPKWDVNMPLWSRILFGVGILVGHFLAAFEGPELHRLPGGWANVGIWILIVITMLMHYDSTLYLARYSEEVVVPTAVVQFGPYRWVRHPIYASTMLLFATYCTALHAPLSLLFLVAACLVYYNKKAKLEEELMVENFGQSYSEYADKPVVADAASLRFTIAMVSFVIASVIRKGFLSNGNLDDAASANTWLLLSTFLFSSEESRDVLTSTQKHKLVNDTHVFKWMDEALLNEIETLQMKTEMLEHELKVLKTETQSMEKMMFEKVKLQLEKELDGALAEAK